MQTCSYLAYLFSKPILSFYYFPYKLHRSLSQKVNHNNQINLHFSFLIIITINSHCFLILNAGKTTHSYRYISPLSLLQNIITTTAQHIKYSNVRIHYITISTKCNIKRAFEAVKVQCTVDCHVATHTIALV